MRRFWRQLDPYERFMVVYVGLLMWSLAVLAVALLLRELGEWR